MATAEANIRAAVASVPGASNPALGVDVLGIAALGIPVVTSFLSSAPPVVTIAFSASGDISSFDTARRTALQNTFATQAGGPPSAVEVIVTAGSVQVRGSLGSSTAK